jgi:hypothetical protein
LWTIWSPRRKTAREEVAMKTTTSAIVSLGLLSLLGGSASHAGVAQRESGVQVTPDGKRTLISKDVGGARWAITRNDDATVTGNVFYTDGRPPDFVFCAETGGDAANVTLRCRLAAPCPLAPCAPESWVDIAGEVELPRSFFSPPVPPLPEGPLGRRRFSIDPATSGLRSLSAFGPSDSPGFTGWLELDATEVDPASGQARVDVVAASPLITLDSTSTAGPLVICIEPMPDQFPVIGAGVIDCDGGTAFGYDLGYDHNAGVVGSGITEQQCASIPGVVEDGPHANVCNAGPVVGTSTLDTGPGGLIIAQIPGLGNPGLQVRITSETALPCFDEGPPIFEGALPLTTGRIATLLQDLDNVAGATLRAEAIGANFSCTQWREENGPGTLILSSVTFDLQPASFPGLLVDVISTFTLDD